MLLGLGPGRNPINKKIPDIISQRGSINYLENRKHAHILPTLITRKIKFIDLVFLNINIGTYVGQKTAKMI